MVQVHLGLPDFRLHISTVKNPVLDLEYFRANDEFSFLNRYQTDFIHSMIAKYRLDKATQKI